MAFFQGTELRELWGWKLFSPLPPLSPPPPLQPSSHTKIHRLGGLYKPPSPLFSSQWLHYQPTGFLRRLLVLQDVSSFSRCRKDRAHRWRRKMPPGKYNLNFKVSSEIKNVTKAIGWDDGSNHLTSKCLQSMFLFANFIFWCVEIYV